MNFTSPFWWSATTAPTQRFTAWTGHPDKWQADANVLKVRRGRLKCVGSKSGITTVFLGVQTASACYSLRLICAVALSLWSLLGLCGASFRFEGRSSSLSLVGRRLSRAGKRKAAQSVSLSALATSLAASLPSTSLAGGHRATNDAFSYRMASWWRRLEPISCGKWSRLFSCWVGSGRHGCDCRCS